MGIGDRVDAALSRDRSIQTSRLSGRESRAKNCSKEHRSDRRFVAHLGQLRLHTEESGASEGDRFAWIVGQSNGQTINRGIIASD